MSGFDYKKLLKNKELRLKILDSLKFIPDRIMVKAQFRLTMHKSLDLKNPETFNEKLNWLKLYDHNPDHIKLVDKYSVREYVSKEIKELNLIPLLGKWDRYEDIPFDSLPDKFVLKCNHDSGSIKIIEDKNQINHDELKEFFSLRLKNDPYSYGREWPYKFVKPCIIAEQYMSDSDGTPPVDYKFFCFNGNVDSVMLCTGRGTSGKRFYFFDRDWKLKKYNRSAQDLPDDFTIEKPEGIDRLFDLASELSKGEAFVRIDFYLIEKKPYFGEFTFYPAGGFDNNILPWADKYLGTLINLDLIKR
ncbi:glycosyl transferase [bacterium]|nr:glycosyl transferase [bacterium]